jgi:chemotaxis protein CheY-P-specific phosphatase CheC
VVAILFPENASEVLVRRVVGIETGELAPPVIESAIAEVGNILASHIASGIADTLGSRLLPSIPQLEMEHADEALGAYIEETIGHDAMRIESAFSDEAGELRGRLVMVPTRWPGSRANEDPSDLDDL